MNGNSGIFITDEGKEYKFGKWKITNTVHSFNSLPNRYLHAIYNGQFPVVSTLTGKVKLVCDKGIIECSVADSDTDITIDFTVLNYQIISEYSKDFED